MPVIGWLSSGSRETDDVSRLPSFRLGLNETGYTEGRNVAIEYRRADDQIERLPALAAWALNAHSTVFRQARGADRSMVPGQRQSTQELRQSDILVATICVTAVTTRSLIHSAYELMLEAGIYRL
jgi:hypothetical protein